MSKLDELGIVDDPDSPTKEIAASTRSDTVVPRHLASELVDRGPQTVDGMFTVPKVID